ncbi:nucleotidyltransferase family protein [Leucobacter sp. CSA1]|uniref:Nucleotidyltransferase family protein n=1 Tax=Leucobacter chromiisoli TaxID=2796471 RepID=A0A934Q735_9MICO|nr:nucleotidyltransferase family protein [Leucobacter chromiisoli]MBK0419474.1 nucleotidyltransferase family protein [Leucobacter chromiisoli]
MERAEAVDFDVAYTLVGELAQRRLNEHGLRVLFIKGQVLAKQGLRPPKTSLDIDLLVHPNDFDRVRDVLGADGWYRKDAAELRVAHEKHSDTLLHSYWPNMIDLHRFWPGFLAERGHIFDLLWEEKERGFIQSTPVHTTGAEVSALMLALHDIRSSGIPNREERLDALAARCEAKWGAEAGAVLHSKASLLSAVHTAAPFLQRLGVKPEQVTPSPELKEWQMQLRQQGRSVEGWWWRFKEAPLRAKMDVFLDASALRPGQLRALRPETPPGVLAFWKAWFTRLVEAVKWIRARKK